ncbi:MAG: aspartate-semialdehyde dehydrogenase [Candidatus Gracilibacteria bacterium]|nr:aspartate-semialdehyde dehydrogenase [Candidatus Gracilibacteria bacterium]
MKNYNIAIIGCTGAVGVEMIKCLENLKIPISQLKLGASPRSTGKIVETFMGNIEIKEVNEDFFENIDYALFSAGGEKSKKYIPIAVDKGVVCIDNSSYFRYDENIPLVVPQINGDTIGNSKIIANPNCTTAIAAVVLNPIYKKYGIKKIIMSTYQATSGGGAKAMAELEGNTQKYFSGEKATIEQFVDNIAFNVIPHIDKFQENGYTKEEMKVVWETQKIFGDNNIDISCTCVRIPTFRAHSESIVLETEKNVDIEDIKNILENAPGVDLVDDIENNKYPMPLYASGKNNVEVGRIRKNLVFGDKGIELFISGDQLLRGAALNAVEILEVCINNLKK